MDDINFEASNWVTELSTLGMATVLAVLCGLLAVAFTQLTALLYYIKKRYHSTWYFRYPSIHVAVVVVVTALVVYPRLFGSFMAQPLFGTLRSLLENNAEDGSFDWGRYNPLVSIAVMLVVRFFLTAAAVPLPLPVGLYATNLIIGAALGRLFGELSKLAGVPIEPNGLPLFLLPACFTLQNKPS